MPKKPKEMIAEVYDSVTDGLKSLYRTKIRPVEEVCCAAGPALAVCSGRGRLWREPTRVHFCDVPCRVASRAVVQVWGILFTHHERWRL